jgi:hypothetical protein
MIPQPLQECVLYFERMGNLFGPKLAGCFPLCFLDKTFPHTVNNRCPSLIVDYLHGN